MSTHTPLTSTTLDLDATYHQPLHQSDKPITLEDPATRVMTDLKAISAVTVEPGASIELANLKMISCAVRLLLVTDIEQKIVGVITASDILGEKPMQHLGKVGGSHRDIQVKDIMTPHDSLEVVLMTDVERAHVGSIIATLMRVGRQHALVVDIDKTTMSQKVRGIFSSTQISRQMETNIEVPEIAHNFAELEHALAH